MEAGAEMSSTYEFLYDSYFQGTRNSIRCRERGLGVRGPVPCRLPECSGWWAATSLFLQPGTGTLKFPEVAWEGAGGGRQPVRVHTFLPDLIRPFRKLPLCSGCGFCCRSSLYRRLWVYDSNYDPGAIRLVCSRRHQLWRRNAGGRSLLLPIRAAPLP